MSAPHLHNLHVSAHLLHYIIAMQEQAGKTQFAQLMRSGYTQEQMFKLLHMYLAVMGTTKKI